jgi:hypothetical protein
VGLRLDMLDGSDDRGDAIHDGCRECLDDWLSVGAAARRLGVRSLFTFWRWLRQRYPLTAGINSGGRIHRVLVERLRGDPGVIELRRRETLLESDLASFDGGDDPVPVPPRFGRRPWDRAAAPPHAT